MAAPRVGTTGIEPVSMIVIQPFLSLAESKTPRCSKFNSAIITYVPPPAGYFTIKLRSVVALRSANRTSRMFGLLFSPSVFLKAVYFSFLTLQALCYLTLGARLFALHPASEQVDSNHRPTAYETVAPTD